MQRNLTLALGAGLAIGFRVSAVLRAGAALRVAFRARAVFRTGFALRADVAFLLADRRAGRAALVEVRAA
jgi:hypothetical protein